MSTRVYTQKGFLSGVLSLVAFYSLFLILSVAHAQSFTRNLKIGDTGSDVEELQKVLNMESATQVAQDGPGSPGNETTYFGLLTADAVRRFQELHAAEILTPLGLFSGTGYFGPGTRGFLENGLGTSAPNTADKEALPDSISSASSKKSSGVTSSPSISYIEPTSGGIGTVVTIHGSGFSATGNRVASVYEKWVDINSSDGKTLVFTVKGPFPEGYLEKYLENYRSFSKDTSTGIEYNINVINENGESNGASFFFTLN